MDKDLIGSLRNFYTHYDPKNVPTDEKLGEFAKHFAGNERQLWDNLYKQFEPDKPVTEALHTQLATLKNPYGAEKKNPNQQVYSPASGVAGGMDSVGTQENDAAPVDLNEGAKIVTLTPPDSAGGEVEQPPVAITPMAKISAENRAQIKADERSKAIAETSFDLHSLATKYGVNPDPWMNEIGGILADKNRPQAENDVLALRSAYKKFADLGVVRNKELLNNPYTVTTEMDKLWERLAAAEQDLRNEDPVAWNKMMERDKDEHYSKLGANDPRFVTKGDVEIKGVSSGDKQLIAGALDNGLVGLEDAELSEAKIRNEIAHSQQKIGLLRASGDERNAKLAESQIGILQASADQLKAKRHAELLTQIDAARQALDRTDLTSMARSAGMQLLKSLEEKDRGFLDPSYEFNKVLLENKSEIADANGGADMPKDISPAEAMRKYLANLVYEQKVLTERINGAEGLAEGLNREAGGLTTRGWNADEKRLAELGQKIPAISRVVLLNEMPETDRGFKQSAGSSFINTVYGASSMANLLDTGTAQGKAMAVKEMLSAIGADEEKIINPVYKKRFSEEQEGSAIVSLEHLGELTGMIVGMAEQAGVGGAAMEMGGANAVFAKMAAKVATLEKGQKFAKVALNALQKGAQYEMTGDIFKEQDHFFNFATGVAGSLGEQAALGAIGLANKGRMALGAGIARAGTSAAANSKGVVKKMGQLVANTFGNKTDEAAMWLTEHGKTLRDALNATPTKLSQGVGSVVGQVAEGNMRHIQSIGDGSTIDGLVKIFQDSDVREKYWEGMQNQFGTTFSERGKFFLDMFAMGMFMGNHGKGIGKELAERSQEVYNELNDAERMQVDEVVASANELNTLHDEVLSEGASEQTRQPSILDIDLDRNGGKKDPWMEPYTEAQKLQDEETPFASANHDYAAYWKLKNALANGEIHKAIEEGRISAQDAIEIIEQTPKFGKNKIEVPADIAEMATRETEEPVVAEEPTTPAGIPEITVAEPEVVVPEVEVTGEPVVPETSTAEPIVPETAVVEPVMEPVPEKKPLPVAGETAKFMTGREPYRKEVEGKVLEITPEGNYRMEITVGGEKTTALAKPEDLVGDYATEIPAKPPMPVEAPAINGPASPPPTAEAGTPPVTVPPVTTTAEGGGIPPVVLPPPTIGPAELLPSGKGIHGIWKTLVKNGAKASDSLWSTLGKMDKYYTKATHAGMYQDALKYLGGWDGKKYTEDPLGKFVELTDGRKHNITEFADVMSRRLVLTDILGNAADQLAAEIEATTDPTRKTELQGYQAEVARNQMELTKVLAEQGTIGGQGTSFIAFWRNIYTHADGMLSATITEHNRDWAKRSENQKKAQDLANDMADIRERTGRDVADEVANSEAGKPKEKKPSTEPSTKTKEFAAKERAKRQESLDKLKNLNADFNKRMGGTLTSGGILLKYTVLPVEATIEIAKIGISLAKEGAVRFADWAPKVRDYLKGVVEVTDEDLKKIFESKDEEGVTPKSVAEAALDKASVAPKAVAANAESLRTQIQRVFREGGDIKEALMDQVKLTSEEADFVMKRGESVIDGTAKELAKKQKEAKEKTIEQKERERVKEANAMAEKVAKSRRLETDQKISTAMNDSLKADGGKSFMDNLIAAGFSSGEAMDIIVERRAEFAKRADEALKNAGKQSTPSKPGEPSFRKKVQDAINAHFDIKNDGSRSLKDRLMDDAGLTEQQADKILDAEQKQLSERTKAMNDKVDRVLAKQVMADHFKATNTDPISLRDRLMRDAGLDQATADAIMKENARDIAFKEKQAAEKIAEMVRQNEEQQRTRDFRERESKVREALIDHFGQNTMAKEVAKLLGIDAATTPEEKLAIEEKAKQAAKFGKMKLIDGRTMTKELMVENLMEKMGMDVTEATKLADAMIAEKAKTLFDRVKEKTGLEDAEVQAIVDASKAEFDARARRQVEARAKKVRARKQRSDVHRPTTDVDRALETLHDTEFDVDTVNAIFRERLGFVRDMTPAEAKQARGLAKALADSSPGSILELNAARNLDRFFDTFIPRDSLWKETGDIWTSLMYAGMLSGIATSIKNIVSAATIVSLSPLTNIGNMSAWVDTWRQAGKAGMEGGAGAALKAFGRAHTVTQAVVKYGAAARGAVQGWRYARDIWQNGWIDNKFIEGGKGNLGRQMNVSERRYWDPFGERLKAKGFKEGVAGWVPWFSKYAGRNLQAQDVFLRTIAYEMSIADAVRRVNIGKDRAFMEANGFKGYSYPAWVSYEMSMQNPKYAEAAAKALEEVNQHELDLGTKAKPAAKERFVKLRTRELLHEALPGLKKGDFETADAMARSQIFTHPRGGINGQFAALLNKAKGNEVTRALLAPFIPFTTIVGNLGDTAFDYTPFVGAASANGVSLSEITRFMFGRKSKDSGFYENGNAKMGSQRMSRAMDYDPKKSWLENRLGAMASMAKNGHGDPLYYEQMGRQWLGVQTLLGMMVATGEGSPLQLTWDDDRDWMTGDKNDTGREYSVMWNGEHLFKYTDFPMIAAPLGFVAAYHSFAKQYPAEKEDLAARSAYAFWAMNMVSSKMSVAESATTALDALTTIAEGIKYKSFKGFDRLLDKYLKSATKAMPQRWSFFEQAAGLFDTQKYDKKGMVNSLEYYALGVGYTALGAAGVKKPQLDIYADPIKHSPVASPFVAIDDYVNEISKRPWIKFNEDRGITFNSAQNSQVAWDNPDAVLGVEFRDYDAEQYYYYNEQAGILFKQAMLDIMETTGTRDAEGNEIPAYDAEGNEFTSAAEKIAAWDAEIVTAGNKKVTKTESKVRYALAKARKKAREMVFEKYNVFSPGSDEYSYGED